MDGFTPTPPAAAKFQDFLLAGLRVALVYIDSHKVTLEITFDESSNQSEVVLQGSPVSQVTPHMPGGHSAGYPRFML